MKFRVKLREVERAVEFKFASEKELEILERWEAPQAKNPLVADALEYRSLAGKRWRSYAGFGRTVSSKQGLRRMIRQDSTCEAVFVLVAFAAWHAQSPIIGFCFCRRTWADHLIIDFAASHPNAIKRAGGEIRGVGSGMLYSVAALARNVGIKLIWGEATLNSVAFYKSALDLPSLTDHFFIEGEIFDHCLRRYAEIKLGKS